MMADGSISRAPGGVLAILEANPVEGEIRSGGRRFWTGREEKILRETYPTGGLPACLPLLSGRTAKSIYLRAGQMGLHVENREQRRREPWTTNEHIDAAIRRAYGQKPSRGDITKLAHAVMRPRWWVTKRAQQLGICPPRFKPLEWSPEEREIIAAKATNSPKSIRKFLQSRGYDRTETAILVQLKRMGMSRVDDNPDLYSCRSLAELMGVDQHTVGRWIEKGWLRATRTGTGRTVSWNIHRKHVRTFVIENVAAVDIRKVDKWWFVDMLAGIPTDQARSA